MTPVMPLKTLRQVLRQPWASVWRLWDRLTIYLPVLMMGVLALGTYWLVRNSPVSAAPEPARALQHEADYFMRKFTIKTFGEDGRLKSEIYGVEARHYPDTDTLEIDEPRIRSISPEGRLVTSTSQRGLANGDGSEVQLFGNAHVVRAASVDADGRALPQMEFQGEFLHAFVNEERVKSHLPVVLTRGGDQFSGDTFAFNNLTGIANLTGRVKGLLIPRTTGPVKGP